MDNTKQDQAQVSIIIPTYNESENIIQVLKSIDESIPENIPIEAIVVDDNSPDGTGKMVEDYINDRHKKTGYSMWDNQEKVISEDLNLKKWAQLKDD